jgi:tetratricopeptide (TPR) repeat protein
MPSVIEGRVKLEGSGNFSTPAFVQLFRDRENVQETYTDLEGRFRFSGLNPGYFRVVVRLDGYRESEEQLYILGVGGIQRHLMIHLRRLDNQEVISSTPTVSALDLAVPERAAKEYKKATESCKVKDLSSAIKHFKKALQLYPSFVHAQNDLGLCYRANGQLELAEKAFEEAIRINEKFVLPYLNLADMYAAAGRHKAAQQLLEKAIAINPQEGEPYFVLGKLYFDQGQFNQAEAACRKSHELRHRTADVHLLLAKIYLQQKQYSLIVKELETYLSEDPNGVHASQVRANLERIKLASGK